MRADILEIAKKMALCHLLEFTIREIIFDMTGRLPRSNISDFISTGALAQRANFLWEQVSSIQSMASPHKLKVIDTRK